MGKASRKSAKKAKLSKKEERGSEKVKKDDAPHSSSATTANFAPHSSSATYAPHSSSSASNSINIPKGDGAAKDGATGDGATGDGATGDGATGDGATGDGEGPKDESDKYLQLALDFSPVAPTKAAMTGLETSTATAGNNSTNIATLAENL